MGFGLLYCVVQCGECIVHRGKRLKSPLGKSEAILYGLDRQGRSYKQLGRVKRVGCAVKG